MTTHDDLYLDLDEYEQFEEMFNPLNTDRQARRARKPRVKHRPRNQDRLAMAEVVDDLAGLEGGFETTYRPSKYESGWLLSSLRSFYEQNLISDVLAQVKGGKEASVYRCVGRDALGGDDGDSTRQLAAKVYRPRMFRQLRNDKMYREGREVLTPNGQPIGKQAERIARAIRNKTGYGAQASHTSWLMYEYTALQRLYDAGAAVPQPIASSDNAILMSYHGDVHMPAPTLNSVRLEADEVEPLFKEVLRNVELMLQHDLIHGDLSAYNILYWAGQITLIDFPQVTNLQTNSNAYFILERDITRICEYFVRQGLDCDDRAIMGDLWYRYGTG